MIKQRSLVTLILLSAITGGIYGLYWIFTFQRDLNTVCGDGDDVNPGLALVLFLVTCGIYPIIWLYMQGERMNKAGAVKAVPIADTGVTYLLWALVGSLLCGIGALVANFKMIKNFNALAMVYNHQVIGGAQPPVQ